MILALIIIGLLLWLIGVLVIGLVCYRRRRNRKVPVRKR
ncbi:Neurogenic locus delta [Schistosoma japonicum]|nr:Neurogenic locus delta [Schistosoma japonicum]